MIPYERYKIILNTVKEKKFVQIKELLTLTKSSLTTLRNDIDYLEEQGKIDKIRGGIGFVEESSFFIYQNRESVNYIEKEAIGIAAQDFIHDGDIILLTNGTTTSMVAKNIDENKHITIITNGIDIVLKLKDKPNITTILLGGIVDYKGLMLIGPTVTKMLDRFNPMKIIMGAGGITEENGITVYDLMTATDYPKILSVTKDIIVVADHSKIGRNVLAHIAPIDSIDTLITDDGVGPEYIETFKKYQINCILAKTGDK